MMQASEGHRLGELLRIVSRHLNLLAATVARFQEGEGVPLDLRYHFRGNLCQKGEPALFVVDRTAVFKGPEIEGRLKPELANDKLFRSLYFSHTVKGARHQVLALVRYLIHDLQKRGLYLPGYGLQLFGEKQLQQVQKVVRGKEEAMIVAATKFMAALQQMSVAVHRHLETAGAFQK